MKETHKARPFYKQQTNQSKKKGNHHFGSYIVDDRAILQWQHCTRRRVRIFNAVNGSASNQITATTGSNLDGIGEAQQPQASAQQSLQQGGQAPFATGANMQMVLH